MNVRQARCFTAKGRSVIDDLELNFLARVIDDGHVSSSVPIRSDVAENQADFLAYAGFKGSFRVPDEDTEVAL